MSWLFFLSAFKTCDLPVSRPPFLSDDKPAIICRIVACSMSFVFVCSRFSLIFSFQRIDYDMSRCGLLLCVLFWFLQIFFPFCFSSAFRIPNTCVLDFFLILAFPTEALFTFEFFSTVLHRVVSTDTFLTSLTLLLFIYSQLCIFNFRF